MKVGSAWRNATAGGLLLACGVVRAQEPAPVAPWSLTGAVTRALATHPSLESARAGEIEAQSATGETRAAWWPSVRLSVTATQYEEPTLVLPLHSLSILSRPVFDHRIMQGNAVATFTVFDGGARQARTGQARALERSAGAGLNMTQQALVARCIAAFVEVRTQQEILGAQNARLGALAAEQQRVQRRLAAGRAAQVELLRVEAGVARAAAERVSTQQALAVARSELARLTGSTPEEVPAEPLEPVALADTTLPARDAVLRAASEHNADLLRAAAAAQGAEAAAQLARSARWPELRAQGTYSAWSNIGGDQAAEWNAGLQLYYPLFTGGATRRAIERADAARRGAVAEQRVAALQIAQDIDRALARVAETHALARSLAVAVDRSAEVVRIERLSLDAGSGTQTDYLRAEAELLDARAGLVQARHGEITARSELARVSGALDLDWIARNLEARP